jgi:hypothetical protein
VGRLKGLVAVAIVLSVVLLVAPLIGNADRQSTSRALFCETTWYGGGLAFKPGVAASPFTYSVSAQAGRRPASAALSCARGRAVIAAGIAQFGHKVTSSVQTDGPNSGTLKLVVDRIPYVLVEPTVASGGTYVWSGASTRIEYHAPQAPSTMPASTGGGAGLGASTAGCGQYVQPDGRTVTICDAVTGSTG